MFLPQSIHKVPLSLLSVLLLSATFPGATSAASGPRLEAAVIGSVIAAGPVALRGVSITREGTVFSGDTVRTQMDAFASVALRSGQQIELGSETDVRIDAADDAGMRIAMNSGQVSFSSPATSLPLSIEVDPYQIVAAQGAAGDVMFLGEGQLGLRAVSGTLTLHSASRGEPIVVGEGEVRVIALGNALALGTPPRVGPMPNPAESQLGLRIVIVSGDDAEILIETAASEPLTVVVVDRDNLLIPGATVEFVAPQAGPGGVFANGLTTFETVTDDTGQAAAGQYIANATDGAYGIQVTAEFEGEVVTTVIPQRNVGPGGSRAPLIASAVGGGIAAAVLAGRKGSTASRIVP